MQVEYQSQHFADVTWSSAVAAEASHNLSLIAFSHSHSHHRLEQTLFNVSLPHSDCLLQQSLTPEPDALQCKSAPF